jgi:hypothetical protein
VKRTTNLGGASGAAFGEILSNTVNALTYSGSGGYGPNLSFANSDSLQIWKVDQALDQPGRVGGSLIVGRPPSPPTGWNDQATEPCYSWSNTREGGAHVNFSAGDTVIRQGEHYFNDTAMPEYKPYVYPHPLVSGQPMPTLPGSPPPGYSKAADDYNTRFHTWFSYQKEAERENCKIKKNPRKTRLKWLNAFLLICQ